MQPTKPAQILYLLSTFFVIAQAAHGQTIRTWTGAGGQPTNYTNGFNWTGGQIPTGLEIAQFFDNTANNLTSSGNISAGRLNLSNSNALGQGSFAGNTQFNGSYRPGNNASPASVSLEDAVFGDTNTLSLIAGFFGGTQSDHLSFASLGAFGGTLDLDFAGGYTPQGGDSFDLFDGPTTGAFSTLDFPDVSVLGLKYDASQLYATGVVSLVGLPLAGDYNQNGVVDAADFTVWRDLLGQSGTGLAANGTIDDDYYYYNVWRAHFGEAVATGSIASSSAAVPEPATLAILILSATGIHLRHRHISQHT